MSASTSRVFFSLPPLSYFSFPPDPLPRTIPSPPSLPSSLSFATSTIAHSPFTIPPALYTALLDARVPLTIASCYVVGAKTWNSINTRRQGRPWAFSKTALFFWAVVAHNVFLAVYSAWTFVGISRAVYRSVVVPGLSHSDGQHGFLAPTIDALCHITGSPGYGNSTFFNPDPSSNLWVSRHPTTLQYFESHPPSNLQPGRLWNEGLAFYGWLFYLSKFYEVVDTIVILMKGKQSSTLQTYHHMGAMIAMWAGIRYMSPAIFLFVFLNSAIHAMMYTYYTITSFSVRVPKPIKQTLTTLQITQFLIGATFAAAHLFVTYTIPSTYASELYAGGSAPSSVTAGGHGHGVRLVKEYKVVRCLDTSGQAFAVWFNVAYLMPLTYLFGRFFVQSYLRGGKGKGASGRGMDVKSKIGRVEKAAGQALKGVERKAGGVLDVADTSVDARSNGIDLGARLAAGVPDVRDSLAASVGEKVPAATIGTNGHGAGASPRRGWERAKKTAD